MNRFQTIALVGFVAVQSALAAHAGIYRESSASLNEFPQRYLPVLVNVDSSGKVTDVASSTQLKPAFDRLLRKNLDEMIVGPAIDRKGKPIASQLVMNLVVKVSPLDQGKYDASFAYLSSTPVPYGSWYWVHINGHRLALASRDAASRNQRLYFDRQRNDGYRPSNISNSHMPTPAFQNASRSAPAPAAPPSTRGH